MDGELRTIDSGILQYAPKGAYYEGKEEQQKAIAEKWMGLFKFDRTLFALLMLLNGTGYSKGAMTHILLSNPLNPAMKLPAKQNQLPDDFEKQIILYSLYKEKTPRALKNLLMLAGGEGHSKVNNSRTRKIILEYIFNRDNRSLDNLAVNYKNKLKKLIRHALGKQDLRKALDGRSEKYFRKYNQRYYTVLCHIFNKELPRMGPYFPLIEQYSFLKTASINKDIVAFKKYMKNLPIKTVLGFRNLYKVPIELSEIYENTKMSNKERLQAQAASNRAGAKVEVNLEKQDIYELFKYLYFKINQGEVDNIQDVVDAIDKVKDKMPKVDIGECVIVIDASHSMRGSEERPMHPFLTSLSIISALDVNENIKGYIPVGGESVNILRGSGQLAVPHNGTELWKGLLEAVETGIENIVVISDGYENTVKGMFGHVYNHLKKEKNFKVTHINPVFTASSANGTGQRLADDIKPLPVGNYKFLETEVIFLKLIEQPDMVKRLLIQKYNNLLPGGI